MLDSVWDSQANCHDELGGAAWGYLDCNFRARWGVLPPV
jgi:hypothetical protein